MLPSEAPRVPTRGIATMMLGIALFSVLNGVVKAQAQIFPINQIVFFRNAFALLPLFLLLRSSGGSLRAVQTRPRAHVALSVLFTLTLFCLFYAYSVLPLADATAIAFSQPLFVVVLASLLALERPGALIWWSVAIGLAGVLLMARPGGTGEAAGYALALLGSVLGAGSMLVQRSLALTDATAVIAIYTLGISALCVMPTLPLSWVAPTGPQLLGLTAMGVASGLCQFLIVHAFYHATASQIAPVTYTKMLWAIVIGYLWFGDVPSVFVLTGAVIVMAAAALSLHSARDARGSE
ncbi:MAG: DMT family transporter [Pseudomonadota bacterium]